MVDTTVAISVVVISCVALAVFVSALRGIVASGEWVGTATLWTALTALCTSLVDITVTFSGGWKEVIDVQRVVSEVPPAWAYTGQTVLYTIVIAGCLLVVIARAFRRDAVVDVAGVLLTLLALASAGSALLHGDQPIRPYFLVLVAMLAAAALAPRGLGVHIGIGSFCVLTAIASGLALAIHPAMTTFACTADKCGILGFNFRGVLGNENAFALYLALGMPFVYIAFGRVRGSVLCAYALLLILLTGSRSGMVAGIVTAVMLLCVQPDVRRPMVGKARGVILFGGLLGGTVLGIVLPFLVESPEAFTGRAYLWELARSALASPSTLLIGAGAQGWDHLREAGVIDASAEYSAHNQWLHVLFSTGIVGFFLFVAALVVMFVQAGRRYCLVIGSVLVPVVALGVTERPWSLDLVDWLSWTVAGAIACYPLSDGRPSRLEHDPELIEHVLVRSASEYRASGPVGVKRSISR